MSLFDLTGKVALITGGNGGIGLGMAKGLSAAGAAILVIGRNADKNARAVAELRQTGVAEAAEVDMAGDTGGGTAVAAAIAAFGHLDILINNAGTNIRKQPQDYSLAEWKLLMDVNLTSAFLCSQAAFTHNAARRRKDHQHRFHDVAVRRPPFAAPYGATKRWHRANDKVPRQRLGALRHSSQRRAAGLDRHRSDDPCPGRCSRSP